MEKAHLPLFPFSIYSGAKLVFKSGSLPDLRRFDSYLRLQPFQASIRQCPSGGTGRRKGLKIPRQRYCAGSSPVSGTNISIKNHRQSPGSKVALTVRSSRMCSLWDLIRLHERLSNTCLKNGMWGSGCPPALGTGTRRFESCHPESVETTTSTW